MGALVPPASALFSSSRGAPADTGLLERECRKECGLGAELWLCTKDKYHGGGHANARAAADLRGG
jgi:hypothetical protein